MVDSAETKKFEQLKPFIRVNRFSTRLFYLFSCVLFFSHSSFSGCGGQQFEQGDPDVPKPAKRYNVSSVSLISSRTGTPVTPPQGDVKMFVDVLSLSEGQGWNLCLVI